MSQIIPKSSLESWARKMLREPCSTVDLIASVEDRSDKIAISIVALLEVEPAIRYLGMHAEEAHYIKSCHRYLTDLGMKAEAVGEFHRQSP